MVSESLLSVFPSSDCSYVHLSFRSHQSGCYVVALSQKSKEKDQCVVHDEHHHSSKANLGCLGWMASFALYLGAIRLYFLDLDLNCLDLSCTSSGNLHFLMCSSFQLIIGQSDFRCLQPLGMDRSCTQKL